MKKLVSHVMQYWGVGLLAFVFAGGLPTGEAWTAILLATTNTSAQVRPWRILRCSI